MCHSLTISPFSTVIGIVSKQWEMEEEVSKQWAMEVEVNKHQKLEEEARDEVGSSTHPSFSMATLG